MSRRFGLPLAASLVGHGCALALLILLADRVSPLLLPAPRSRAPIVVMLTAPQPEPQPPPPPVVEKPPPPPPPPLVEKPPPPPPIPAPMPLPPPVVEKPPPKPPPRRAIVRRRPPVPVRVPPPERLPPPLPEQTASVPPPSPPPAQPVVSAAYRAALGNWLESHKEYPERARRRGEQGRAVLRFRVDRSGRVLSYSLAQGTGYADLDAAVDRMMRGARLPPFPPDMPASDIEVSVAIRFSLAH